MTAPLLVRIKLLHPRATLPSYATTGAACFDLKALIDTVDGKLGDAIMIPPGQARTVSTGLAFELPQGHVLLINSRSGHGFKHGVRLANSQGILDEDYRGEAMVRLHNDGSENFVVPPRRSHRSSDGVGSAGRATGPRGRALRNHARSGRVRLDRKLSRLEAGGA